jgi:hypothetical protein
VILPHYGEALDAERLAGVAFAVEQAGLDSGWVPDRVIAQPSMRARSARGHANKFVGVFGVPEHPLAQTGHRPAFSSGMKTALIGSFLLPSHSIRHRARGTTPAGFHHVDRKSW